MSFSRRLVATASIHLALFVSLGLILVDTFGYSEKTNKYLGFGSEITIMPVLLLVFVTNMLYGIRLDPRVQSLFRVCTGVLLPLIGGITYYWVNTLPNSVYAQFRLHPMGLVLLFITMTGAVLLTQSKDWWKRHWVPVVVGLPFLGWVLIYCMSFWPMDILKEVVKEDNIIEWLQFWVALVGGILSLIKAKKSYLKKQWVYFAFYSLAGIGFLAAAGDEIAWGQRLLGIEASEDVWSANRQGEYTVHNLYAVEWAVQYLYAIICGLGVISRWGMKQLAKIASPFKYLVPFTAHYALIPLFLLAFIYFIQQIRIMWGIWHVWSEPAELLFYTGIVLWVLLTQAPSPKKVGKK